MQRHRLLLTLVAAFCFGFSTPAAEPEGNLYQLGIAVNQEGLPGAWKLIGNSGAWKNVRAGAILKGRLYTAESDGALHASTLDKGERGTIGKAEFGATVFMCSSDDKLWTLESSGNLYKVAPDSGNKTQVGAAGAWKGFRAGALFKGRLYSAEKDGTLHATDLASGGRKKVGNADFGNTSVMAGAGESIYSIEADGSMYRVNPDSGEWAGIGPKKGSKPALGLAAVKDEVYMIDKTGFLFEVGLPSGKKTQLGGKPDFVNTKFMFAGEKRAYTIEEDGNLYQVDAHPEIGLNDWDCFPREFEKVFQEQAKPLFRNYEAHQVLGGRVTHARIMDGIKWLQSKATAKDMVVFYITMHGETDSKEGWCVGTADGKTLWGHELKAEFAKLPCHALVFIESCGSGGFAAPHPKDPPVPGNVTVICACAAKQKASNELDVAALEALWGRGDFNHDGVVDLDELLRYVELRYKEWAPANQKGADVLRPVVLRSKTAPAGLPLTKVSPQLGAVEKGGEIHSALIGEQEGKKIAVHLLGWNDHPGEYFVTDSAPRDRIILPDEGPALMVEQKGTWYPARLLSKEGDKYKVHYLGYNEEETVTKERVKYAFAGGEKPGK